MAQLCYPFDDSKLCFSKLLAKRQGPATLRRTKSAVASEPNFHEITDHSVEVKQDF
jgi:hypothetical protein